MTPQELTEFNEKRNQLHQQEVEAKKRFLEAYLGEQWSDAAAWHNRANNAAHARHLLEDEAPFGD